MMTFNRQFLRFHKIYSQIVRSLTAQLQQAILRGYRCDYIMNRIAAKTNAPQLPLRLRRGRRESYGQVLLSLAKGIFPLLRIRGGEGAL